MTRIQLRIYTNPGQVEVFANLKQKDGYDYRLVAIVDTGAAVSLLPITLMNFIDHRITDSGVITLEQAGIAKQSFRATEAIVKIFLEDEIGARTPELEVHVWFANTHVTLIGFKDLLDRAVMHLDIPNQQGWIEINPAVKSSN